MQEKLQETIDYISKQIKNKPEIGIVLGTGLGRLVDEINQEKSLPYNFIPHFPISTVESHFGKLIFGTIGDKQVVAMQGRFHFYEGYNMQEITFPIRVMKLLGVKTLFISNASGAVNLDYQNGDLMILDDHINLQGANPLTGPNITEMGPRFPDMSAPYDKELNGKAARIAKENNFRVHTGVYIGVQGPNLETRAEYRMMRILGADVVGMSTVPEVIVARHMDMKVCAISVITDVGDPDNLHPISLDDVIAVANEAEPKLTHLLSTLIKEL